jgi:hypothetical protein
MYCMAYFICGNVVFLTGMCSYRSNHFERPCMSNLFVIPFKSYHTPPQRAKIWLALPDTNGIQGLNMGCKQMLWRGRKRQVHLTY